MQTIVIATKNIGKVREFLQIVQEEGTAVKSMMEMGVDLEIDETGTTFEENALIKAKAVWEALGGQYLVLSDDSGLEIDYFDKAPGIYSSRWLGEDTSYDVKNQIVLDRMQEIPEEKRGARYVCAIAAVLPGGEELVVREEMEGRIAYQSEGTGGFGYDPIIWIPECGCTVAAMTSEAKNAISHRGKALRSMETLLGKFYKIL